MYVMHCVGNGGVCNSGVRNEVVRTLFDPSERSYSVGHGGVRHEFCT